MIGIIQVNIYLNKLDSNIIYIISVNQEAHVYQNIILKKNTTSVIA